MNWSPSRSIPWMAFLTNFELSITDCFISLSLLTTTKTICKVIGNIKQKNSLTILIWSAAGVSLRELNISEQSVSANYANMKYTWKTCMFMRTFRLLSRLTSILEVCILSRMICPRNINKSPSNKTTDKYKSMSTTRGQGGRCGAGVKTAH